MEQTIQWSVFRGEGALAVVPRSRLLIRLRQMVPDTFFGQEALKPLKSLMDTNFIIGPSAIIAALYLPSISLILVIIGVLSLALSSLYWFTPHWLCTRYLRYRGFAESAPVEASDFEAARTAAA